MTFRSIIILFSLLFALSCLGNTRSFFTAVSCHAATDLQKVLFCEEPYNKFREIRYWGAIRIELYDLDLGSNDTNALNLHDSKAFDKSYWIPKKTIMDHFESEFNRLIKRNIPYYDADQGGSKRLGDVLARSKEQNKSVEQAMSEFSLQERLRRQKLYGDNPGVLYCRIRVKRHEFPVLFEIKSSISGDKEMKHDEPSLLKVEDVGYSTPANIEAEIEKAITAQLEILSENFWLVRNCPSNK